MSWLKRIGLVVISLLLLVLMVAYACPAKVHVERVTVIEAPPERVFAEVIDFRRWQAWSPWYSAEPTAEYTFSGAEQGVGAVMAWNGKVVGTGKQVIVAAEPVEMIQTSLDFGRDGLAQAAWFFQAANEGTRVTWGFDADMGLNPIGRLMGLMMDRWIGGDYEKGLAALKQVCESAPGGDALESKPVALP